MVDKFGRVIRDLRISITDRCNFRCTYCLPEGVTPRPHDEILSFEEITRLVTVLTSLGVEKVRVTGGEPLLRRDAPQLLGMISAVPGVRDLALTTNGWFLARHIDALKAAGIHRLNISLDSLRPDRFRRMTGVDALSRVLESLEVAVRAGFAPLKINSVVIRGENDDEVTDFADFALTTGHTMRFIEFMPLDSGRAWDRSKMVSGREIVERISARHRLVPVERRTPSETALRYRFAERPEVEIGVIAPVTQAFCGRCNRIRITADGQVRTCLFSTAEHDLKAFMRGGASDDALRQRLLSIVLRKEAGHRINESDFEQPERTMSCIGG
ncbi:MAG: GTP 3',8-cyclase MoaA [Proteobacteria bacterium]|nr:GTP 3',8-cyclase MoaA [Pseudomonadota bacterium]